MPTCLLLIHSVTPLEAVRMISANRQDGVAICSIVPRDAHVRIPECRFPANECLTLDFLQLNHLIAVQLGMWRKRL